MGRRPGVKHSKASGMTLAGMGPEVKEELNDIALMFFREAKKRLGEKIEAGEFKDLTLKELMKEFNAILKSLQGPATSLTAINLPAAEQHNKLESAKPVENLVEDPDKLKELRERQAKFLENQNGSA